MIHLKHEDYEFAPLKEKLRQAFELAKVAELLESRMAGKKRILLKPNLVWPGPASQGHVTHPNFILAVAELLQEMGFTVGLGESPGAGPVTMSLIPLGLIPELKKRGIEYFTFTGKLRPKHQPEGFALSKFPAFGVGKELAEWDGLINLPKLKSHQQTLFSGAMKNLFGCIPGKKKALYHFTSGGDLDLFMKMLHHVALEAAPILNIADGIEALHVKGPIHGETFPLHSILIGSDVLEIDWQFCKMVGLDPLETPQFKALLSHPTPTPELTPVIGDELSTYQGFKAKISTPIMFSFPHLIKSVTKSLWAKSKNIFVKKR